MLPCKGNIRIIGDLSTPYLGAPCTYDFGGLRGLQPTVLWGLGVTGQQSTLNPKRETLNPKPPDAALNVTRRWRLVADLLELWLCVLEV